MKKEIRSKLLLFLSFPAGFLSGISVMNYLEETFHDLGMCYAMKEVFCAVFFSRSMECRDYLSLKNILLFRWLYLFFGLGIIIFGRSYLTHPKSYHLYIWNRCNSVKTGLHYIFRDSFFDKAMYVILYVAGIIGSIFIKDETKFDKAFLIYLLLFVIGKILQLSVINTGMFLLYLKYDVGYSILGGFVIVTVLVLLDLLLPISLVFCDSDFMFADTILLNGTLLLICNAVKHKMKLEMLL